MQLPLSWLKEYIPVSCSPLEIGKMLTMAGLEVEAIQKVYPAFQGVVVGHVLEVEKHPNADRLSLAKVSDGKETFQVVCGAPNCRQGMKTAFAAVGATLVDDQGKEFKVKQTKIRGSDSFGMLCSGKELRISEETEGILELPPGSREGENVREHYSDTTFEISLTPNLGHCASVIGVARELSAVTEISLHWPSVKVEENSQERLEQSVKVDVQDREKCPRYACRMIKGVKVGPSPEWLKNRLQMCGFRSVNNVVDATNYVLMEMGHPLHAFDYDQLKGGQVVVRTPKKGEKRFVTLDGKERLLDEEMLLICDAEIPVAIAGVMGGGNSEVGGYTQNVLVESAYFHPGSIRRTSKKLSLQTEASKRFERGADPNNVISALDRVVQLIQELAGGQVVRGVIDEKEDSFSEKIVDCRLSRVNQLLGTHFSVSEVESVFQRLSFPYEWDGQDGFRVRIPTYRVDVYGEVDLIEEIARIYGYDNIAKHKPYHPTSGLPHAPIFLFEKEVRSRLIAEGLQEFLTCDLISPTLLETLGEQDVTQNALVKVLNPTSIEQSVLRPSLMPGLLQLVKYNFDRSTFDVSGFEIGRIHFKEGEHYKEQSIAAIVLSGRSVPHHWGMKPSHVDFFDLKGMIENVLKALGINYIDFRGSEMSIFHSGRQASIFAGPSHSAVEPKETLAERKPIAVGVLGEVHPAVLRRLDIPQRVFYAAFNLHDLFPLRRTEIKMEEIPIYPGSERDWTITLKEETPARGVLEVIRSVSSPLLEEVKVLDVYRSERLGRERKNVTFRLIYRDLTKTVAQETVDIEHEKLTKEALHLLGKAAI